MLHAALSEAVSTASESIAKNSVLGALLILALGAVVVLWRRDVKRGDEALARESSRADAAERLRDASEKAKAELEKDVRERFVPLLTTLLGLLPTMTDVIRDSTRRRDAP